MEKLETYCQVAFLDNFFHELSEMDISSLFFRSKGNTIQSAQTLRNIIFDQSILLVDDYDHIAQMAEKEDVFYDRLIKSMAEGGTEIINFNKDFPYLVSDCEYRKSMNPSSIFLLDHSRKFDNEGFVVSNSDDWEDICQPLGSIESKKVHSNNTLNEFSGWDTLRELNLPVNAAIIADGYIHKDLENNLFQIIENVLPQEKMIVDFHLSIITNPFNFLPAHIEKTFSFIKTLNREYSIDLSIFLPPSPIHDRNIISNYWRINSGHSLDYYDNKQRIKGNKSTTLDIYGIASMKQNAHFKILRELKSLMQRCIATEIIGSGKNRLMDVV